MNNQPSTAPITHVFPTAFGEVNITVLKGLPSDVSYLISRDELDQLRITKIIHTAVEKSTKLSIGTLAT